MVAALHATEAPSDIPAAIRTVKAELRARIGDYRGVFAQVEDAMRREVAEIVDLREQGQEVWPVVAFADIAAGTVPQLTVEAIRRRGCAIVRGTFPRERAQAWDAELVAYLDDNDFMGRYRYLDDGVFGGLAASKPSIFPIYWSRPQVQAREDANMVAVRGFLNGFWRHESQGRVWFDPNRDTAYPDRIRRRAPGTTSGGLSAHTDSGSIERWLLPAYQQVFRHVYNGDPTAYDPWDGAYRTEVHEFESTVMCSAFRTFQGWTALSDMDHDQGVLHTVPIPEAMAYLMLRPLLDDVPEDDMCGVTTNQVFPASEKWHPELIESLSGIPDVKAGDSVWWHADMVHSVAPVTDQKGWGNVMYIPAAPWCPRNEEYAKNVREAFLTGSSPTDFPEEHYERAWVDRFHEDQLNQTGRRGLGLG